MIFWIMIKTSITTREILEKWPGLKKLDEEKDGAVRRRSYMSDKRICGEVAAAASYVGFQWKIFKSRGDIGLGISEKCLQKYDVRASQRWDIPRTKLTS